MGIFRRVWFASFAGLLLFGCRNAAGWMHEGIADPDLVKHSDLIAVASVQPNSIVFIRDISNGSWKHTAVLVIKQVIKGKCDAQTLPVIFHYGMDPLPLREDGGFLGVGKVDPDPNSQIVMGYQGGRYGQIPGDLRKDHIWFLSYPPPPSHPTDRVEDPNSLGVSEPEELQPVDLKPYFEAFLTPHLEELLKQYASGNSNLALRSQTYLNHLAIEQILKEPDVQIRAKLLLPYFLFTDDKQKPPDQSEAAFQLWLSCKDTGAALLLPYFNDPKYQVMQTDIMSVWMNAQYHGSIPPLVDLLDKETKYWQTQTPAQRDLWIHMGQNHGPTMEQIYSMTRVEMIFFVFRQVPDLIAKAEVAKISPIWKQMFSARSLSQEIRDGLGIPNPYGF